MKSIQPLILFLFISSSSWASRQVEFEWEEIQGARQYQVELRDKNKKTRTFYSKTSTFKFKMPVGRYEIRGKVQGENPRDIKSDWSEWREFNIPPRKIKSLKLKTVKPRIIPSSYTAEVPLDWDDTEGASEYLLEVMNEKGKIIDSKKFQKSAGTLNLRPGTYKTQITAITKDGLSSEASISEDILEIKNIPIEPPKLLKIDFQKRFVEFKNSPETQTYITLERKSFLGEKWKVIEQIKSSSSTYEWKQQKPGNYRITFYSVNSFREQSSPITKEFIIKPIEENLPH